MKTKFHVVLYGDKGKLVWPSGELLIEQRSGKLRKKIIRVKNKKKASKLEVDYFVHLLKNNKKQFTQLKENHFIIKLIESLYKSSAKEREIYFGK